MLFERWLYIVRLRLRSLFLRNAVEDDLSDEIRDHLERQTQTFVDRGLPLPEARDAALRAFGGVEQRKEECRDVRRVRFIDDLAQDTRYGLRTMARSPGFTAVAVLSLAIGIGANTAIFTLFDALLLKPLPVHKPEELRVTEQVLRVNGRDVKRGMPFPYAWVEQLRSTGDVFSEVLASATLRGAEIGGAGRASRAPVDGVFVSANYFTMLDVRPQLGRAFDPSGSDVNDHTAVVLGDSFWRRELGANPQVLGQPITVNGVPFTVIGVAPASFFGLTLGRVADVYLHIEAMSLAQPGVMTLIDRNNWSVEPIGRLKPGVTDSVAGERLTMFIRSVVPPTPNVPPRIMRALPIETGLSTVRAQFLSPLSVLMGMVALLLLIGCANVATMLLARASARRTEIGIRAAIGAGQGRLRRQLATESLLLVMAAGSLGILFATWAPNALLALLPPDSAPKVELTIDGRILAFTIAVSALCALASGLTPALHALRLDVGATLRERRASGTGGRGRAARSFVIAQVALSFTLVIGAGLLARTLHGLTALHPGFDPDRMVLTQVDPGAREYEDARLAVYYRNVLDRLRATPDVTSATLLQFSFLTGARTSGTIDVPGFTPASDDDRVVQVYQVGPSFFATFGMTVVEGRDFTEQDLTGSPVGVAFNETAARRYFGQASAIGRSVQGSTGSENRIIAVVRDARYNSLRDDPVATIFVPYTAVRNRTRMTFAARVANEEAGIASVAAAIGEIDRLVPTEVTTLRALLERSLGQERLLAIIASFFAVTALLLLSLGLHGVLAFWVNERTPEIGVRLALGARRWQVVCSVLQQPLRFVLVGGVIGLVLTLVGSRFIASLLFGLTPEDPSTILGALLLMIVVATLSGLVPARRASRVDPMITLRCE